MHDPRRPLLVPIALAALVAGCATSAPNPELDEARLAFRQVQDDPEVRTWAPVRLDEAETAIVRASAAHAEGADPDEVSHLAYLADRRIEIARARAVERKTQADIEALGDTRHEIQLSARERAAQEAEARARTAEAEALALQRKLAELEAEQTERGLVLTLGDILFDLDRAELTPGGMQQVARVADFLRQFPERNVLIEGHTDDTGDTGYNESLALRRAQAVQQFLIQQNRRVEIVILKEGRRDDPRA